MQIVPLLDTSSQTLSINLGGQACQIAVKTRATGLYIDLYVNNVLIIGGAACRNLALTVINSYLGFVGDLMFSDTQGADDPSSPGLGSRFLLFYVEASDLAAA